MTRPILACTVAVSLAGCFDVPDVGPLLPPDAGGTIAHACADGDPGVEVSLARDVRPILARCTCHGSSATSGFSLGSYDGLRRGGLVAGSKVIVPGAPCSSVLYEKISPTPPFGSRMPFNGPPYLSPEQISTIRDWIAEGASDN